MEKPRRCLIHKGEMTDRLKALLFWIIGVLLLAELRLLVPGNFGS